MNYQTLANEIALPTYAGMSDADVADALNALSAATRQRVAVATLQARAYEIGASMALRMAIVAPETPAQLRVLCEEVLSLVNSRLDSIDLDNPGAVQMFGALVQAGVLTQQQAAQIDALATVPGRSRAQEIGVGMVTAQDVAAARAWQTEQEVEAGRVAAYASLRERLITGYRGALAQLQARQESGAAAPAWDDVLAWM